MSGEDRTARWTPGERLAAILAQEINDAPAEELIKAATDDVLRGWAAKIREVGTAKGWSTWAAAYMDPDVEFVDTDMPSTETIVAELRRLDRLAVLREAADAINALPQDYECDPGRGDAADLLRRMADEATARPEPAPLVVSRYDVAMEPAPEEEPVFTVGAIAEDGRPVALLFDPETRQKVAGWLGPGEAGEAELERLRTFASVTERRHDEIRARLAMVDIRDSAEAWDLGMAIIAILEGPLHPDIDTAPPLGDRFRARVYDVLAEAARTGAMEVLKLAQVRQYLAEVITAGLLRTERGA